MCSSKSKLQEVQSSGIKGQAVLVPNSCVNRTPLLERCNSIPMINKSSSPAASIHTNYATSKVMIKPLLTVSLPRNTILPCNDHQPNPKAAATPANNKPLGRHLLNKSKSFKYMTTTATADVPGSIAAARREQVAILHEQRKMRIAHYGRTTKSLKLLPASDHHDHHSSIPNNISNYNDNCNAVHQEKRCAFITPNSDPIYVAYHDEEWGVPVHHDELLFELLVLTGAQVGSDWTSVLRKRQDFRDAFSRFDAEIVSKFSEKKMAFISAEYCIELSLVRGVVDNAKRIIQMKKEFGSLDKYLWGFVNHKAMVTQYKWWHKTPAKTSKSETISKDMVRRGFRQVGPTVIHSFMQAAGLTNDHLITCPRHSQIQSHHLQLHSPPTTSPHTHPSLLT